MQPYNTARAVADSIVFVFEPQQALSVGAFVSAPCRSAPPTTSSKMRRFQAADLADDMGL